MQCSTQILINHTAESFYFYFSSMWLSCLWYVPNKQMWSDACVFIYKMFVNYLPNLYSEWVQSARCTNWWNWETWIRIFFSAYTSCVSDDDVKFFYFFLCQRMCSLFVICYCSLVFVVLPFVIKLADKAKTLPCGLNTN